MADVANKYPENVAGKFYVDNQCIDCDLCRETAPDNFKRNEDGGYSFVFKQPASPEEEARCKEAKEGCPVEAIGDNGAGFTAEAAQKAPAPFFTTRNVGLGLGLTVSRKIIETHRGKLEIIPPAVGHHGVVRVSLPADSGISAAA